MFQIKTVCFSPRNGDEPIVEFSDAIYRTKDEAKIAACEIALENMCILSHSTLRFVPEINSTEHYIAINTWIEANYRPVMYYDIIEKN